MRSTGLPHGIEYRFSMCGLIWLPRPRMNRPSETWARFHAEYATVIGVRAKATAIAVPMSIDVVRSMALYAWRKGS